MSIVTKVRRLTDIGFTSAEVATLDPESINALIADLQAKLEIATAGAQIFNRRAIASPRFAPQPLAVHAADESVWPRQDDPHGYRWSSDPRSEAQRPRRSSYRDSFGDNRPGDGYGRDQEHYSPRDNM